MQESEYWLWLSYVEDMWQAKMELLYKNFSSAKEIYNATEKELLSIEGIKKRDVYNMNKGKKEINLSSIFQNMAKKNIKFTYFSDKDFPQKLKFIQSPPMILFYKGKLPETDRHAVGIVGARACTEYGRVSAYNLAKSLAINDVDIISGMARGIDAVSHKGCINGNGSTYAILGCGVDVCYPAENIELYEQICVNGGIISEYIPNTKALAWHFPQRNRIISAFSDSVVMIEAKEKSGSFITVDYALEQGKSVYALPGRITDVLSTGCNKLISEGALPLLSVDQIISDFFDDMRYKKENKKENKKNICLAKEYKMLYSCLGLSPITVDEIMLKTGLGIDKVYEGLMYLQLEGIAKEVTRGQYVVDCEN